MPETRYGIPGVDPVPLPEPGHRRRITREKLFEVVSVILLIICGFGYLSYRNYRTHHHVEPATSLAESIRTIEATGAVADGQTTIHGLQFISFRQKLDPFACHIDLVGVASDAPLDAAVIWLTPNPGQWSPTEESLQIAVNSVGQIGQKLVTASSDAFEKAANTMTVVSDTARPHEKGVAGTSDGWKITYITYRSFDENSEPQPVLFLILHRLSAASDDQHAELNRALYEAVEKGDDVKTALQALKSVPTKP
jgi:hypothetical protein